jgi:putative endonuclease
MIYYVYILSSRSRNLYTGITNNLTRRVLEHRNGTVPGFTKRYRIHRLVYYESYRDVRDAIAREKQIKAWTRAKRVALIEEQNRRWSDLAADWFENKTADPSTALRPSASLRASSARDDIR